MRVGIIQSSFIPWRGYFDIIDEVDLFVFLDDVQYTASDWRNRNRLRSANGSAWLTVPVKAGSLGRKISETELAIPDRWLHKTGRWLRQTYGKSPHFNTYYEDFLAIMAAEHATISSLNQALTHWLMACLGIETRTICSTGLGAQGVRLERVMDVLLKVGATDYLSGPSAANYLSPARFEAEGIGLSLKSYDYRPYPQPKPVVDEALSVLDLLFCCGPEAPAWIKSHTRNPIIVPPARIRTS